MHESQLNFLNREFSSLYKHDAENQTSPWRVSTRPFVLSKSMHEELLALGNVFALFNKAVNKLYFQSLHDQAPSFVASYLEQGKPESIIKLMRQNRFKNQLPHVIRPDLLLTETGFVASELDSIPGGLGFVGVMSKAYAELGFSPLNGSDGMLRAFSDLFKSRLNHQTPTVAIVVSDEGGDYLHEWLAFSELLRKGNYLNAYVCHPRDFIFSDGQCSIAYNGESIGIDALYRFFELFDLPNISKQELMLYAARHKQLFLTPPPKANLEEKLLFSFLWHPALDAFWKKELGDSNHALLKRYIPQTWVIDPTPMGPQGCIAGLDIEGRPVFSWDDLKNSSTHKDWVIKPSGFSELAWGAHGVSIGASMNKEQWNHALTTALNEFNKTPYILQKFQKTKQVTCEYYDPITGQPTELKGRVRLCPYYFAMNEEEANLGGILATICPMNNYVIHGKSDAIMTVCSLPT